MIEKEEKQGDKSDWTREMAPSVCRFVKKLWKMVHDSGDTIIGWSKDGQNIVVADPAELEATVLPRYFRHGNISSLVRQLSSYSFQRRIDKTKKVYTFKHPHFQRGKVADLVLISRKPQVDLLTADDKIADYSTVRGLKRLAPNFQSISAVGEDSHPSSDSTSAIFTSTSEGALFCHPLVSVRPPEFQFAPSYNEVPTRFDSGYLPRWLPPNHLTHYSQTAYAPGRFGYIPFAYSHFEDLPIQSLGYPRQWTTPMQSLPCPTWDASYSSPCTSGAVAGNTRSSRSYSRREDRMQLLHPTYDGEFSWPTAFKRQKIQHLSVPLVCNALEARVSPNRLSNSHEHMGLPSRHYTYP